MILINFLGREYGNLLARDKYVCVIKSAVSKIVDIKLARQILIEGATWIRTWYNWLPLEVALFGLAIRLRWRVKDKREGGDAVSVESFRWEIGFYLGEEVGWILCFVVIRMGMEGSN